MLSPATRGLYLGAAALALALGGCKDKPAPATPDVAERSETAAPAAEEPVAEEETAPAAEAEAESRVHIRVALIGGPDEGTHESSPPGAACVDYQSSGVDGLGVAFHADPSTRGIALIDFGTREKVPVDRPSGNFGFTVAIGQGDGAPVRYVVRPDRGQGSGTYTVTGSAPRYTVRIEGKTAAGVGVDATLECLE